jgi:hypothetical protein
MRQPAVAAKGAISPPPNHAQFLFIAVRVKPYASSDSGWATTERPRPGTRPVTLRCVQRLSTEHMAQAAIWRQRQQQAFAWLQYVEPEGQRMRRACIP